MEMTNCVDETGTPNSSLSAGKAGTHKVRANGENELATTNKTTGGRLAARRLDAIIPSFQADTLAPPTDAPGPGHVADTSNSMSSFFEFRLRNARVFIWIKPYSRIMAA